MLVDNAVVALKRKQRIINRNKKFVLDTDRGECIDGCTVGVQEQQQ